MNSPNRLRLIVVTAVAVFLAGCSAESKRARLLERATEFQKSGDYERARIEFQNVLQLAPEDLQAHEALAAIWHDRGSTMRAIAHYSKIIGFAPGNLEARIRRAQLVASLGKTGEAKREALGALERSTSAAEALVVLTETVRDGQDLMAAEEFLKGYPEKNSVWYHIATANLLNFRGDRTKAKASLDRALAIDPKSAAAHSAMGGLQAMLKNAPQAAAEHKAASDLSPLRSRFRLQYAGYLAQSGDMPAAIALLNDLAKKAPDAQHAWRALAQVALAEGRHADALGLVEKALALDASDYEAMVLRARVWHVQGDLKKAIAEYERIGGMFPGAGVEKHHLGLAQLQSNNVTGAVAALEQAAALFPDNIEAAVLLAQLQLKAGDHDRVVRSMATLLARRGDLVPPYLLLIEAMKAAGKLEALADSFAQNLAANPNNALLHYMLANCYAQMKKPAEARRSLEKSLEVAPDFAASVLELGAMDIQDGKPAAALQRAQAMIAKAPKSAAGPLLAARAYEAQEKWSDAEASALDAVRLDPNQALAYGVLVKSFVARKAEPGLAAKVEAYLAKFPNDLSAVRVGAQVFVELKDYNRARDLYEKFLAANPNVPLILNNLAALYADNLKQPDRALELARKARALAPADPAIADTLGWILYQRKENAEALALLEESAKAIGGNPEVQYHLGLANRAMGRTEAALAALRLAAAAPGDFTGKADAKRQLAELEKAK